MFFKCIISLFYILFASVFLSGCATLPSSGPSTTAVKEEGLSDEKPHSHYVLIDVSDTIASLLASRGHQGFKGYFGDYRPTVQQRIGKGDSLAVSLWEAASGGLFSSAPQTGAGQLPITSGGARGINLPEQIIASDGGISVPYAGRISVVGLTPYQVEQKIVKALEGKALQPQAIVTISKNIGAAASVIVAEGGGGRVPLTAKGDKVLDVIAQAGGVKTPIYETFITMNRLNKTARIPLQVLINKPSENIIVRPDDVITLTREPQTFTAIGASAKNAHIPFEAVGITLEEAVAKAGGLIDTRSDPEGVFLMRYEPIDLVRQMQPKQDLSKFQTQVPVIYRLNLREAQSFFMARRFPMRNKDILYISNAPMNEVQKALSAFNLLFTPAYTVNRLAQ